MKKMNVMIDTEIWSISLKAPKREKFGSEKEYSKAFEAHKKARTAVKSTLQNDMVYMSQHQISELFHVLAFRGTKLPLRIVNNYVRSILDSREIIKVEVTWKDLLESMQLSAQSGIHIWDFLCFVPLKEYIDVVYTNDKHFTHSVFKKFNVKIVNPLDSWKEL
ncbi:MAG: hypothetical protein ACTSV0_10525 [Candidatus Freyarchaeota archaeon]